MSYIQHFISKLGVAVLYPLKINELMLFREIIVVYYEH